MGPNERKRHLQASVGAAAIYGLCVGAWMGVRASQAGWAEWIVAMAFLFFAPGLVGARIDARYRYSDADT